MTACDVGGKNGWQSHSSLTPVHSPISEECSGKFPRVPLALFIFHVGTRAELLVVLEIMFEPRQDYHVVILGKPHMPYQAPASMEEAIPGDISSM